MLRDYLEMLRYRRPEGSRTQAKFCNRFLKPIFGDPDEHGNFILQIGDNPWIAFTAHHDTVHSVEGKQSLSIDQSKGHVFCVTRNSDCLGADCTTGVWLILQMIEAKVPGMYIIHAAEEEGCKGSRALVADAPDWLSDLSTVISFDRKGTNSIITKQMGFRTASDDFAKSLAEVLNLDLTPDPTGSYTDSNEYAGIVPECTNLSVGYYHQHTKGEYQDLRYLITLRDALISADWTKIRISREPEADDWWDWDPYRFQGGYHQKGFDPLEDWVVENADLVAAFMRDHGLTRHDIEAGWYMSQNYAA